MMRHPIRFYGLIVAVAALAGCNGDSDSTNINTTSAAPASASTAAPSGPTLVMPIDPHAQIAGTTPAAAFTGAPSPGCYSAAVPRRLTRTQYINALTDWSNALISDGGIGARIQTLVIDTAQFPIDASINPESTRHQGYYRLDPTVTTRQVTGVYTVAQALAADLASSDGRVATMLGNCTGEACLNNFIRKAGSVLYRQPLSDAEVAVYRKAAGSATDRAAITRLLGTMIASPQSYYVLERGNTSDTTSTCVALTPHELAARLSLHLWDTIPDAQLRAAADNASLLQPAVYAEQIRRLMADPRADAALRSFFRQWFRLDELVALNGKVGDPRFDAFAGTFRAQASTRDAAINEVLDMVSYVAARNGSLQQVLSDRHSFARTAELAELYKTPVWNGSGTPPTFAEAERVGLLTRIGLMANGSTDTTLPIQRGIKVLSALTCQALPAPAMNQTNAAADLSGVLSTRERTERVTQMEGTTCIGCHKEIINPWGFVFEGFDALGRVRSTEVVRNDAGTSVGQKAVDSSVTAGLGRLATRPMSTAAQAQQYVLESGEFEHCFARNYFRYAFGRADVGSDAEVLETIRKQAVNGANLRSLFASIVTRDEFKSIQRPQ